jgi:SAM-dependent methyltransferase
VLDRAHLAEGEHLLDVGCGEGLIGFGALERGAGTVTFSDISTDLLDVCRNLATDLGVLDRCDFVEASADDLGAIDDASVDVVTTRSVLIYVSRKPAAFAEFARVLRTGGRVSIYEPINRFGTGFDAQSIGGYELGGHDDTAAKLRGVFEALQPSDSDPMLDFDERDLIRLAEQAGFFPIALTLDAVIEPLPARTWEGFVNTSGNPNIPTLAEAMDEVLTHSERERLTAQLRPLVEQGRGTWRMATAFLVATKP